MPIDLKRVDIHSLEVEDVYEFDYPDFADAYLSRGYTDTGHELTDEDLEYLTEQHPDLVRELAMESLYGN